MPFIFCPLESADILGKIKKMVKNEINKSLSNILSILTSYLTNPHYSLNRINRLRLPYENEKYHYWLQNIKESIDSKLSSQNFSHAASFALHYIQYLDKRLQY